MLFVAFEATARRDYWQWCEFLEMINGTVNNSKEEKERAGRGRHFRIYLYMTAHVLLNYAPARGRIAISNVGSLLYELHRIKLELSTTP